MFYSPPQVCLTFHGFQQHSKWGQGPVQSKTDRQSTKIWAQELNIVKKIKVLWTRSSGRICQVKYNMYNVHVESRIKREQKMTMSSSSPTSPTCSSAGLYRIQEQRSTSKQHASCTIHLQWTLWPLRTILHHHFSGRWNVEVVTIP